MLILIHNFPILILIKYYTMDKIHVMLIVAALITGAGNTLGKLSFILGFTLQNKQPVI